MRCLQENLAAEEAQHQRRVALWNHLVLRLQQRREEAQRRQREQQEAQRLRQRVTIIEQKFNLLAQQMKQQRTQETQRIEQLEQQIKIGRMSMQLRENKNKMNS